MLPKIMCNYRTAGRALTLGALLVTTVAGAASAQTAVSWTAVTNATATGATLKKVSGCSGCADAGAISQQRFTTGSVTFTVASGSALVAGLGHSTTGSLGYAIDYAFKFWGGGSWEIREGGTYRTEGPFAATDVFTVAIDGPAVNYYRNGSLVYTSKVPASGALGMDASLDTLGATVQASTDASAPAAPPPPPPTAPSGGFAWTNLVNATASGNTLQKVSGCGTCSDAGATSSSVATSVSFSVQTTQRLVAGLGHDTSASTNGSIDYAFKFSGTSSWEIREQGTYRTEGPFASSDVFMVAVSGGVAKYYRNGALVYTSKVPVTTALVVDTSLESIGATVQIASAATTAPPTTPPPPPTGSGTTLRLLQWNIHHGGYGTDNVYDPNRVATWAASVNPDVVMFNEVEKNDSWGNQDQPEVYKSLLQQKTGKTWYYVFAQEFGQWNASGKGNLILSTYPISVSERYEMVHNGDRSIGLASITVNNRDITLISTHLDPYDQALRLQQATEVTSWAAAQPENRIITGDMNAWPDQTSIAQYNKTYYDSWAVAAANGTATAFSGNNGETKSGRIDYILYSKSSINLTVKSSQVIDTRDANGVTPSDHRPVFTVFQVK